MANLNGVNVVVPERITYNGVEYVRSEGDAAAGDIIRLGNEDKRYLKDGGYYMVDSVDEYGDPQITDNDDDEYDTAGLEDDYVVFKKATEPAAGGTEIVTHEGANYRKVKRVAKPGDLVIVTDWKHDKHGFHDVKVGEIFTVERVSPIGGVLFVKERAIKASISYDYDEYRVLEPVTYREVKRRARVGERIRIVNAYANIDYENGDEFEVISVSTDYVKFIDRVGDRNEAEHDEYVVLEPVKAAEEPAATPEPTPVLTKLPEPYVIHDGRLYVKEQRQANVGELVIITEQRAHYVRISEIVKCIGGDNFEVKASQFNDSRKNDGRQYIPYVSSYRVLTPAETVEIGGTGHCVEKRKANVGERVLVVANTNYDHHVLEIGQIVEIARDNGRRVAAAKMGTWMADADYVVLTPCREVKRNASVGERIRIVELWPGEDRYKVGDEFIVDQTDISGQVIVNALGRRVIAASEYVVLEPVTTAEKTQPERLKVGDYVRVVDARSISGRVRDHVKIDEIRVITKDDRSVLPFQTTLLDGTKAAWFRAEAIVRATEAEVAVAKRKQAEEARWAAIGRKVGEIKNGDIVRVIGDNPCGSRHKNGDVGVVRRGPSYNLEVITAREGLSGRWVLPDYVELVVPVEQRFDRAASEVSVN